MPVERMNNNKKVLDCRLLRTSASSDSRQSVSRKSCGGRRTCLVWRSTQRSKQSPVWVWESCETGLRRITSRGQCHSNTDDDDDACVSRSVSISKSVSTFGARWRLRIASSGANRLERARHLRESPGATCFRVRTSVTHTRSSRVS